METAIVPGIYDPALADEDARVETETAWDMLRRFSREEGLFVGASGAAALAVALRVAQMLERGLIVAKSSQTGASAICPTGCGRDDPERGGFPKPRESARIAPRRVAASVKITP